MTRIEIAQHRLHNQQIIHTNFQNPREIVAWMGAMQAQDFPMSKWALGVRLPNATDNMIENAINNANIIRTHILRPTWHLVSAQDIYWMLALTAPHLHVAIRSMNRNLELDDVIFNQSNDIIIKSLEGGKHLTRAELMTALENGGIKTNDLRAVHLMFRAELEGIVCNGARRGKEFTYALLEERVPEKKLLTREESLAELAKRYFTSHGPATLPDFSWWSGLPVTDARKGVEAIAADFRSETIDNKIYYFPDNIIQVNKETIHLLPAFDEFMVSYKDRSASLSSDYSKSAITGNGIFKPIIMVNGRVVGAWKRTIKKNKVIIEPLYFDVMDALPEEKLMSVAREFGRFLELEIDIKN